MGGRRSRSAPRAQANCTERNSIEERKKTVDRKLSQLNVGKDEREKTGIGFERENEGERGREWGDANVREYCSGGSQWKGEKDTRRE